MAEDKFSKRMNRERLCAYLEWQGLEGDDLQKMKDAGHNGRTILLLRNNNYKALNSLQLRDASILVLKTLLEEQSQSCCETSSDQPDSVQELHCNRRDPINYKALTATNEYQRYAAFGLGHAVDASEPAPLKKFGRLVRSVCPEFHNTEKSIQEGKHFYTDNIESMARHSSSVTASVSDIVGKVLALSAEAEYTREKHSEMKVKGERINAGRVSFRPFKARCSTGQDSSDKTGDFPDTTESNFEHEFCEWFIQEFPDTVHQKGDTFEDKVQSYLRNSRENFDDIIATVYGYIKNHKITHYISAIQLGAARYSLSISHKCCHIRKMKHEAGVEYLAEIGMGMEASKSESWNMSEVHCIGNMEEVSSGKGQAVIGYDLSPIFRLICHEHTEIVKILQRAIYYYLKRSSGPFTISCICSDQMIYWKVDKYSGKKVIVGTDDKAKASVFYIEKQVCPGEFNITYYGEEFSKMKRTKSSQHLTTKSKLRGKDEGPLRIGGGRAANLTLRHPGRRNSDLGVEYWESDACFIRLAPRKMQKKSYIAFDTELNKTVCVHDREEDGAKYSMRFILTRVEIESCRTRLRSNSDDLQLFEKYKGGEEDQLPSIGEGIVFNIATKCSLKSAEEVCGAGSRVIGDGASGDWMEAVKRRVECDSEDVESAGEEDEDFSDFDFEFEFDQTSDSD